MMHNSEAELLEHLLRYYSFELDGLTVEHCVAHWRDRHPDHWLRSAVVEALYQGRYKAVSVSQILDMWHRRGQSLCHYNGEFERMICNKFLPLTFSETADSEPRGPSNPTKSHRFSEAETATDQPRPIDDALPIHEAEELVDSVDESSVSSVGDSVGDSPPSPVVEDRSRDIPPSAGTLATQFNATEPEVSLLEDEFLEVFAAGTDVFDNPHGIAPFRPSAEVPAATSRFSQEAIALETPIHQFTPTATTSDLYSKLKAALNRVVSTSTNER